MQKASMDGLCSGAQQHKGSLCCSLFGSPAGMLLQAGVQWLAGVCSGVQQHMDNLCCSLCGSHAGMWLQVGAWWPAGQLNATLGASRPTWSSHASSLPVGEPCLGAYYLPRAFTASPFARFSVVSVLMACPAALTSVTSSQRCCASHVVGSFLQFLPPLT